MEEFAAAKSFSEGRDHTADGNLSEKLSSMEAALDRDPEGVSIFNRVGRLDYVNPSFCTIYEICSARDIVGLSVKELETLVARAHLSQSRPQCLFAPSSESRQSKNPERMSIILQSGRGVKICHYPFERGGWISRHVLDDEMKSRNKPTEELISLQALIDQLPDYLWVKDTFSRFVVANLALALDCGRQRSSDLIGLTDFDLHEAHKAAHFKLKEEEILRTGTPMLDEEEAIVDACGQEKWLSSSKIPLRNGSGDIAGLIGVARDITARKKAEELRQKAKDLEENSQQLEKALDQERRASALQRQFVSMASHEFRTPLAIIDGAAQRLVRRSGELSSDFVAEKCQHIRRAVNRMVELMESILSVGRLESGTIGIKFEELPLRDLVSLCCKRQQELAENHRISTEFGELPKMIVGDRSALEQVITNLLSNAVKYSPTSPQIDIRCWQEGNCVHVAVQDYGIGIDQDDLPKMFERYFRARTSTGIAGTGIGLTLVKQIVELHGGRISVVSHRGEGSRFTVSLPIGGPENISSC
ncbi:sensor histidine kinase [Rhizobium leguminosarum]|nr:PAS domain-containing sensor histidine kinase [Rhizobium leguminosarum]